MDARADGHGWNSGRRRIGNLRESLTGWAIRAVESMRVGGHGRDTGGIAMAQVTKLVQHRTLLDKHQQERQQQCE
jgi:hypothetical protein